jgi:hypothetical protein
MTQRQARIARAIVIALIVQAIAIVLYWQFRQTQKRREDFTLLQLTAAIHHYVDRYDQWPRNWDSLRSNFVSDDSSREFALARYRFDVNFLVDCTRPPSTDDWYIHLKTGDMPNEFREANDELRSLVTRLNQQKKPSAADVE